MKKEPLRTCIITREIKEKKDLLRLVVNKDNQVFIDLKQNLAGRGFYIQKEIKVIEKFLKSNYLKKRFKIELTDDIKQDLLKLL